MRTRVRSALALAVALCLVGFGGAAAATASTVYKDVNGNWVRTFTGSTSLNQCRAFQNNLARDGHVLVKSCYFDGGAGSGSLAYSIVYK